MTCMERPPDPNVAPPPGVPEGVRKALYRGKKIEAIKLHREATGLGLKEAREAIEQLDGELRASSPELFEKVKSGGCMSLVVGAVVVGGGLVWFGVQWVG